MGSWVCQWESKVIHLLVPMRSTIDHELRKVGIIFFIIRRNRSPDASNMAAMAGAAILLEKWSLVRRRYLHFVGTTNANISRLVFSIDSQEDRV